MTCRAFAARATVAVAALTLVGCGGGATAGGDGSAPDTTPTTVVQGAATTVVPPADGGTTDVEVTVEVARPDRAVEVHASPGDPTVILVLDPLTELGSARALPIVDRRDGWLRVELPVRPNGSSGWIRGEGIEVREVDEAIHVDLAARTLTLTVGGEVTLTTPVAVGAPDAPTPTGRFYVTDKLDTGSEAGPYGPYAFGLSGHSDVLTEFAGGDGQIGIHGTDDPSSIGRDVSHGCVRVPNDVATRLTGLVPLGTPVTIVG
ncbi:MAG: L,D-transpeptidase [Acidimicrobiia bacterium]